MTHDPEQQLAVVKRMQNHGVVSEIGLLLMVVAGLATAAALPDLYYGDVRVAVPFLLLLVGYLAYKLQTRLLTLTHLVLWLGPLTCLWLAMHLLPGPIVPIFAVLPVIVNYAISPKLGVLSAIGNIIILIAYQPWGEALVYQVVLIGLTVCVQWVTSKGLHTALDWYWHSEQRANKLLLEMRLRQAELQQTLEDLAEMARKLEQTGQELAEAKSRADEARRLKEQFAANISHELRTPLNLILGFSEVMYMTPDVYGELDWPPTLRRDVSQIFDSSRQLLELINDVIDLARIDHVEMVLHTETADLTATIREALTISDGLLRDTEVRLQANIPQDMPLLVFDQTRIRQVLLNLLGNAARFTEKGTIIIDVEVTLSECIVSITDSGIGIPTDELPKLFTEFHQVDRSLRRKREGAGLGLAISKRFVELHGGRIWVESTVGVGSTFRFSLPIKPVVPTDAPLIDTSPVALSSRSAFVIVDDDPIVPTLLRRYLNSYQSVEIKNPCELEQAVAHYKPFAVLVNASLQENVQLNITDTLCALPAMLPVIHYSLPGHSWLNTAGRMRLNLPKPVVRQDLLKALEGIGNVHNVLIVDDNRGFVQLMARYLASAGGDYQSIRAYDGEEALMQIRRQKPDLILLDLMMPGMGGTQLLSILDADDSLATIPVLILSASDDLEDTLAVHGSHVQLSRAQGFNKQEVVHYLRALFDVMVTHHPFDSETVLIEAPDALRVLE
jgi:signal transduction histidine kinase/CheY-like chemotaxis protein